MQFSQLDGNSDFNGLAGIACDSSVISGIINIFRCFENVWENFEEHQLCLVPHTKDGFRCMFCHIRSISLGINRAKLKVNIKPHEFSSQLDQYDLEFTELPKTLTNTIDLMSSYESTLNKMIINRLECAACKSDLDLSHNGLLMVTENEDFELEKITTIENVIQKIIEKQEINIHHKQSCHSPDVKLDTQPLFIVVCFENPKIL